MLAAQCPDVFLATSTLENADAAGNDRIPGRYTSGKRWNEADAGDGLHAAERMDVQSGATRRDRGFCTDNAGVGRERALGGGKKDRGVRASRRADGRTVVRHTECSAGTGDEGNSDRSTSIPPLWHHRKWKNGGLCGVDCGGGAAGQAKHRARARNSSHGAHDSSLRTTLQARTDRGTA